MKRFLAVAALAVGLGGTGAQAQTKLDIQCLDTQVKVVSALALAQGGNGIVGCKESTPVNQETYTSRPAEGYMANQTGYTILADASRNTGTYPIHSPKVPTDRNGRSTYSTNQFSVTPFASTHDTGLAGTAVLGDKDLSVGLKADGTSKMKHGTIGGAARVGDSATVSLTGAVAHEDAGIALGNKDYDGKTLKGEQITLGLDVAKFGPFKTAGISLGKGKAHATELGKTSVTTTENRVVDTPTATENWRDTYKTETTTNYSGSTWNTIGVRGVLDVGTQGELSLRGGAYTNNIMGNKATGGIGYTHYMGTSGKVEVNADVVGENKLYSAKYTKPLSEGWSLTAGVSHIAGVVNDTRAMVGLVWTPGAKSSYSRPTGYDSLDANKVVARNLSSPENTLQGLGNYGKVEVIAGPKTLTGSEKIGETAKVSPITATITTAGVIGANTNATGSTEYTGTFTGPVVTLGTGETMTWSMVQSVVGSSNTPTQTLTGSGQVGNQNINFINLLTGNIGRNIQIVTTITVKKNGVSDKILTDTSLSTDVVQ